MMTKFFCKINGVSEELRHCCAIDLEKNTAKIVVTEDSMPWVIKNFRRMTVSWVPDDVIRAHIKADAVWCES